MSHTATLPATVAGAQSQSRPGGRRFYAGAAVFVILLNAAGFLPSFIDRSQRVAGLTWLVTAHGATACAWLLLFLTQAILVARRRVGTHRRLGVAGLVVVLAMVVTGMLTTIDMARRGYDLSGDIARAAVAPGSPAPPREELVAQMFPPLQAFANFGILVGLGLWFRRRPEVHKRLMLLALGPLVVTPLIHLGGFLIGRWPGLYGSVNIAFPVFSNALLFAVALHDKLSRGRVHPISLWVPILLIVETFGLIALVMPSAAWHRLAMWLAG